jgi:hypothetical protein
MGAPKMFPHPNPYEEWVGLIPPAYCFGDKRT